MVTDPSGGRPPDVMLRHATVADVTALAELHVRTFRETHGGGPAVDLREKQWREILTSPAPSSFCLVLQDNALALIGFVRGIRRTDSWKPEFEGELNKIYLLRAYHGLGLGRRLLCGAAERFRRHDINAMLLFGDAASPSNGFYEAMGAEKLFSDTGEFHGAYGWRDLRAIMSRCAPSSR